VHLVGRRLRLAGCGNDRAAVILEQVEQSAAAHNLKELLGIPVPAQELLCDGDSLPRIILIVRPSAVDQTQLKEFSCHMNTVL